MSEHDWDSVSETNRSHLLTLSNKNTTHKRNSNYDSSTFIKKILLTKRRNYDSSQSNSNPQSCENSVLLKANNLDDSLENQYIPYSENSCLSRPFEKEQLVNPSNNANIEALSSTSYQPYSSKSSISAFKTQNTFSPSLDVLSETYQSFKKSIQPVQRSYLAFHSLSSFSLDRLEKNIWKQRNTPIGLEALHHNNSSRPMPKIRMEKSIATGEYLECRPPCSFIPDVSIQTSIYLLKNDPSASYNNSSTNQRETAPKKTSECLPVPSYERKPVDFQSVLSNSRESEAPTAAIAISGGAELWYQKYKPKSFLDLITDENFNRNILLWLNAFTTRTIPSSTSNLDNTKSINTSQPFSQSTQISLAQRKTDILSDMKTLSKVAQAQRNAVEASPILLVCGPPGCGKSSAVRILARHAGFEVIEIVASEYNTKDQLIPLVKNVVTLDSRTMTSFISGRKCQVSLPRVNLLILDEIEQADQAAVEALIKLSLAKDKTGQHSIIKRPVVCICQDMYARSLRNLRSHVKVFKLGPFSPAKMIKRLKWICNAEGLHVDAEAIHLLVSYSHSDLRLVLNTMEYLSRTKHHQRSITIQQVREVWETYYADRFYQHNEMLAFIFSNSLPNFISTSVLNSLIEQFLSGPLDTSVLLTTLQENLHTAAYSDYSFAKTACLLDIICETDCLKRNGKLSSLLCLSPLLFTYTYCGSSKNACNDIKFRSHKSLQPYPFTLAYKSSRLLQAKLAVKSILCHDCIPNLRAEIASNTFALDIVHAFVQLLSPCFLFSTSDIEWRQYHKLSVRPTAGIPLKGVLTEPLNRFHQLLELLLTYSIKYSKTEFYVPLHSIHSTNNASSCLNKKKFHNSNEITSNVFYLDPPVHCFIQQYCRNFYNVMKFPTIESSDILNFSSNPTEKKQSSTQDYDFRELNATFSGYEYINLQLSRLHGEYLRKEVICFLESGVLPEFSQAINPEKNKVSVFEDLTEQGAPVPAITIKRFPAPFKTTEQMFEYITKCQRRRALYEQKYWRFEAAAKCCIPLSVTQKEYTALFDADFLTNKPFTFTYEPGDAKAVQYYPTLTELLSLPNQ